MSNTTITHYIKPLKPLSPLSALSPKYSIYQNDIQIKDKKNMIINHDKKPLINNKKSLSPLSPLSPRYQYISSITRQSHLSTRILSQKPRYRDEKIFRQLPPIY